MYVTPMGTEPLVLLPCSRHLNSSKVQTSVKHFSCVLIQLCLHKDLLFIQQVAAASGCFRLLY